MLKHLGLLNQPYIYIYIIIYICVKYTWLNIVGSVTKSYPTLCNSMDCSMPDFPVLHYLLEPTQTHDH